jgi:capsular polysaccharide biosynthesis protein
MDLMESFRTLRRRWVLTLVLLLLTLAGTVAAAVKLPWTYESTATVVLLNSKTASTSTGGNPYLAFDTALTQAAEVVSLDVTDPRTAVALQARGYPDGYLIAISSVTGGPILQITVTGKNPVTVEHTLYGVINEVKTKLTQLQAGITSRNLIKAQVLSVTPQPSRSKSKKAKPLVVVLALGLVLTFAIPQIVDGMRTRRQARRNAADASPRTRYPGDEEAGSSRRAARFRSPSATRTASRSAAGYSLHPEPQEPLTQDDRSERRPSSGRPRTRTR